MAHEPTMMKANYYDGIYKRGGKYLIKRFTCPICGKVNVIYSRSPKITNYTCDGVKTELIKESK